MTQPWFKFFGSSWRGDVALRICSIAARGFWLEMMIVMDQAEPRGSLLLNGKPIDVAKLAGIADVERKLAAKLFTELEVAGVFSRDPDGTVFSRKMRRDQARSDRYAESGNAGGNPEIRRGTVPKEQRVRPFRRSDAPEKTRRIFDRDGGTCHWCRIGLIRWNGQGDMPTNNFHVDHVVAVCDGGTNDEENLVAACAACNHKRARDTKPRLVSER